MNNIVESFFYYQFVIYLTLTLPIGYTQVERHSLCESFHFIFMINLFKGKMTSTLTNTFHMILEHAEFYSLYYKNN